MHGCTVRRSLCIRGGMGRRARHRHGHASSPFKAQHAQSSPFEGHASPVEGRTIAIDSDADMEGDADRAGMEGMMQMQMRVNGEMRMHMWWPGGCRARMHRRRRR